MENFVVAFFILHLREIAFGDLTLLFRMGFLGAAHGWGRWKKSPLPKFYHTYSANMKLGTAMLYLRKIPKYINPVKHLLSSTDISIFSP